MVKVRDVPVGQALTDFTMGGRHGGVAWSLNAYVGCQHACTYCHVTDTMHAQRERWGSYVYVKSALPGVLAREVRTRRPLPVYVSTSTDPHQPAEAEHGVTRWCLGVLARAGWPVQVLTRSPLAARAIPLLARMGATVGLTLPTLDDALREAIEPWAPPIAARLDARHRLSEAGIATYANLAPAFPMGRTSPMEVARAFCEAGVQWVNASPWRYLETTLGPLRERQRGSGHEDVALQVADPQRQRQARAAPDLAFARVGLPLHTGLFNPPGRAGKTRHPPSSAASEPPAGAACDAPPTA